MMVVMFRSSASLILLMCVFSSCSSQRGLWEECALLLDCDQYIRLHMLQKIGSMNDEVDIYHARKVITNMLAPRGINYVVAVPQDGSIYIIGSCGLDPMVRDNVVYLHGLNHNNRVYVYDGGKFKTVDGPEIK